jgi:penicillin amidase
MRFVMDWADPDAFTLTPALGQSGHPQSPHFSDFLELTRTGRRWAVPLTRAAADARRASLLRLVPAG